jgi:hypothetical protein
MFLTTTHAIATQYAILNIEYTLFIFIRHCPRVAAFATRNAIDTTVVFGELTGSRNERHPAQN